MLSNPQVSSEARTRVERCWLGSFPLHRQGSASQKGLFPHLFMFAFSELRLNLLLSQLLNDPLLRQDEAAQCLYLRTLTTPRHYVP